MEAVSLTRPEAPAMQIVDDLMVELTEAQKTVADLKEKLNHLPQTLAQQITDPEKQLSAAHYLYWLYPEIVTESIAMGFFQVSVSKFRTFIPPALTGFSCAECQTSMSVKSRTEFANLTREAKKHRIVCADCREKNHQKNNADWAIREQRQAVRLRQLKALPYQEYLKTDEWQARRQQYLKSAQYRCQLCNNPQPPLDVHHRTYVRIGEEYNRDLIVLCRNCHATFHGKI